MAFGYDFPNWIHPPDLAQEYARGVQIGQQAALEQQRLQMQQEENQRAHLMEQQRLEVDRAFKEQELALRKQQLDEKAKLNAVKVQDAARQLTAQKAYADFVTAGGDPTEGLLKFGPAMGESMAGYAGLARDISQAKHPFVPRDFTTQGGVHMTQTSPNRYQVIKPPKPVETELGKFDTADLKSRLKKATTDLESIAIDDPKMYDKGSKESAMLKDFQKRRSLVDMLRNKLASKSATPQDLEAVTKRAHAAIAAGADEAKVKARYKEVTGQELDAPTDTTGDEDE